MNSFMSVSFTAFDILTKNRKKCGELLIEVMKFQDSPLELVRQFELSREVMRMAVPRQSLIKTIDLFKPYIDTKSSSDDIGLLRLHFFF